MEKSCVLAKVVLITKDERDILDDFLTFYGTIFGYENVLVVDNGSTDPDVVASLERFAAKGVVVRVDARPFPQAVQFMSEHMASLRGTCRWILPLETDEFIFMLKRANDSKYATNRNDVMEYLASVPDNVSVIKYGAFYGSAVNPSDPDYSCGVYPRPAAQMERFYNQGWDKLIVRASAFEGMSQWCHHTRTSTGDTIVSDSLGLLHFHETGFRRQVDSAVRVIDSYHYVDRTADMGRQFEQTSELIRMGVACGHKVEYYDKYLRRKMVLDAFRRVAGRLPFSATEMSLYVTSENPAEAVQEASNIGSIGSIGNIGNIGSIGVSWNELLYHEDVRPHTYVVRHVANFFADLTLCPSPPVITSPLTMEVYLAGRTCGDLYVRTFAAYIPRVARSIVTYNIRSSGTDKHRNDVVYTARKGTQVVPVHGYRVTRRHLRKPGVEGPAVCPLDPFDHHDPSLCYPGCKRFEGRSLLRRVPVRIVVHNDVERCGPRFK